MILPGLMHNSVGFTKQEFDQVLNKVVETNFKATPIIPQLPRTPLKTKKEPTPREENSFSRASDQVLTMLSDTKQEVTEPTLEAPKLAQNHNNDSPKPV